MDQQENTRCQALEEDDENFNDDANQFENRRITRNFEKMSKQKKAEKSIIALGT